GKPDVERNLFRSRTTERNEFRSTMSGSGRLRRVSPRVDALESREGCESMSRHFCRPLAVIALLLLAVGCAPTQPFYFFEKGDLSHYVGMATKIEAPDVQSCSLSEVQDAQPPLTLTNNKYEKVWDLTLEEAVHITLQ